MFVFSFPFPGMLVDRFDNHGLALYLTGGLLLSSTVIEVFLRNINIFSQILPVSNPWYGDPKGEYSLHLGVFRLKRKVGESFLSTVQL